MSPYTPRPNAEDQEQIRANYLAQKYGRSDVRRDSEDVKTDENLNLPPQKDHSAKASTEQRKESVNFPETQQREAGWLFYKRLKF